MAQHLAVDRPQLRRHCQAGRVGQAARLTEAELLVVPAGLVAQHLVVDRQQLRRHCPVAPVAQHLVVECLQLRRHCRAGRVGQAALLMLVVFQAAQVDPEGKADHPIQVVFRVAPVVGCQGPQNRKPVVKFQLANLEERRVVDQTKADFLVVLVAKHQTIHNLATHLVRHR